LIKLCVDMASDVQFLHTSGIIYRDIKSDNVLVFSLSPRETVCAKLTDFGSARAGKAHIDAAGHIQLGSNAHFSANEGTPIYMSPQLFARTSRPSEAGDCYSLGMLFYEVASEREPWADVPAAKSTDDAELALSLAPPVAGTNYLLVTGDARGATFALKVPQPSQPARCEKEMTVRSKWLADALVPPNVACAPL
jgi:serine/threonine protein kinase